ncbi:MAG: type III-B CRISPR module RAMP protein Cmr4 [Xanthobacteraceae bacterium]
MPNTRIYWLHALSPTHAGIGQGVDYIDLPIDRDGVTGWPIIRGSGFKGVWADYYTQRETEKDRKKNDLLRAAFGIAGDDNNSNAGALIPTDAKLVCLPVRSFRGTFAWCTSALCLRMLHRALSLAGLKPPEVPPSPVESDDQNNKRGEVYCVGQTLVEQGAVYLEELEFTASANDQATAWGERIAAWVFADDAAWQEQFKRRFVVLPDTAFDFLCETGTEIHTRVRIDDDTKTVAIGALWTEESLPAETILAGIVQCDRVFGRNGEDITPAGLLDRFAKGPLTLQIGGKATIGRGQMRCVFTPVNGGGQ